MKSIIRQIPIHLAFAAIGVTALHAEISPEELVKRQCRSIHLGYKAPPAEWAAIGVTPKLSADGTYFCAIGFNSGYFGMQQLADGKKVIIFSVWDKAKPGHNDRDQSTIPESERVGVIEVGEGVRPMRFGGEGTGSKSFYDYDWQIGETVHFVAHAKPEGKLTTFTGHFFDARRGKWQMMASFRTELGKPIQGLYSFVEDFRRNYESAKIVREANFTDCWIKPTDGEWTAVTKAKFTGDVTPSTNVDAGPLTDAHGFFLKTGGDTEMETTKLWADMECDVPKAAKPDWLQGLPDAE